MRDTLYGPAPEPCGRRSQGVESPVNLAFPAPGTCEAAMESPSLSCYPVPAVGGQLLIEDQRAVPADLSRATDRATGHLRGSVMAVSAAAHICPICAADAIDRVPRDGAVDHSVSLCGWRVYECCECRCRFYDWPSAVRLYCNSITGTLKYLALCMKLLSFELWQWGSKLIDRS